MALSRFPCSHRGIKSLGNDTQLQLPDPEAHPCAALAEFLSFCTETFTIDSGDDI